MKHIVLGVCLALLASASSGCCCFWQNVHQWKSSGHGCGGPCCGTHYLNPHGAQYGAYCGSCNSGNTCPYGNSCSGKSGCGESCCGKSGCGEMYWGDHYSVRPTYDPCDRCGNWIGSGNSCNCGSGACQTASYTEGPYVERRGGPSNRTAPPRPMATEEQPERPTSIKKSVPPSRSMRGY